MREITQSHERATASQLRDFAYARCGVAAKNT